MIGTYSFETGNDETTDEVEIGDNKAANQVKPAYEVVMNKHTKWQLRLRQLTRW